ncbi:MAG: YaiI/YqxD family protein [Sulfurimonas sp.]|uniref:YaiI/YqxD family protein n=1 Tax=Sulfurimonas sp. TaxID=2022749 RepID=UPI00260FFCA5|nr:YaiI/YqxD family protein [Sulfurimonas sp.]MCW8896353.1 YaiI/YqxD family protein [Sulfurimonas sp.]MCW8953743.1 YaiI/YqxD family protein [Sulfurimonas sp.]MCW9068314.1 YaiI/YqxD family protein [Sulfurimonas sp.]
MQIFVDGDAFPNLLKPIIFKQIQRLNIKTTVVANKKINIGKSDLVTYMIVDLGADEADHKIVEMVNESDLVITADIPLADRIISKNAHAIDHRGELYSIDNIKQYLAMRNLMEKIRESGEMTKGPKPFGVKDAELFANQLNAFLTKHYKN